MDSENKENEATVKNDGESACEKAEEQGILEEYEQIHTEYDVITFFGMARCGNHGVINWLKRSIDGAFFINNVQGKRVRIIDRKRIDRNTPSTVIFSCEIEDLIKNLDKAVLEWATWKRILLIRDPFNLYASKRKFSENQQKRSVIFNFYGKRIHIYIRNWKAYAWEYLGRTNHIENKLCISYNKWFTDSVYREGILRTLGTDRFDTDINQMLPNKRIPGSSFDNRRYRNQASKMDVLNRWRYYEDDEDFKVMLADDELMELSYEIFGNIIA